MKLTQFTKQFSVEKVEQARAEFRGQLIPTDYEAQYFRLLEQLEIPRAEDITVTFGETVSIGKREEISDESYEVLGELVKHLIPWRKGPFSLFGIEIDAEWRSEMKWDRIAPHLDDIEGKRIADVGANNGYYLLRLLNQKPRLLFGADPGVRAYFQFDLMYRLLQRRELAFELLGIEHMHLFPELFDIVLCMGVVYHRKDPYTGLWDLKESMAWDGQLLLESIAIPGDGPYCLCPPGRYGKMRNVWYVPTVDCHVAWLEKVGFKDVELVSKELLTVQEQRQTEYAPYESLADFLDPNDPEKTIEGHPTPYRVAFTARKRR